ncbi:MAG: ATP-dependent Clp protease proteolytic subunit [candidate division KSB1 bacterium]|nr:ATP-dependent Clp protease proteolytic subunit [candidate division KSB1 bacterium]
MNMLDLFWLFFMISALQPVIRQRMLVTARMKLMQKIEKMRNSRLIALIHRQETMSLLGFPLMRFINIEDSEEILRAIKLTDKDVPIDLIIHTPGGLVLASKQIAMALKNHPAKVTVFVPHYAMSGGTLIALAADEIVMDPNAVLGPVDPQLGKFPAASILAAIDKKKPENVDDETLILGDVAEKAIRQIKATVLEILSGKMENKKAEQLAELLSRGTWTHDYPIMVDEAKELGLPVSTDMPEEIYQFMNLFPQPMQRRTPAVQYIPLPYSHETRGK